MSSLFCLVDDKHVPLYRIMWVSEIPHFCGEEDCVREGFYEVRLEQDESVWATRQERDATLAAIETWYNSHEADQGGEEGPWEDEA